MKRKNILLIVFLLTLFVFQQVQASTTTPSTGEISNKKSVAPSNASALSGFYRLYMYRLDDGVESGSTHRGERLDVRCQWPDDMQSPTFRYGCGNNLLLLSETTVVERMS